MRLTPMQIIQAATRWPAETMRAQDRLGTIAAGKLADVLIVDADPLQDIRNLQEIFAVVANGSLQDGKYHASYWNPFQGDGPITLPVVDDIGWAVNVRRQAPGRGGPPPGARAAAEAPRRGLRAAAEPHHRRSRRCRRVSATRGSRSPRSRRSTQAVATTPIQISRRSW